MRFYFSIALFLVLLSAFAFFIAKTISDVRRQDYLEYEKLLQSSGALQKKKASFFSRQFRKNVVKEIWWGVSHPLYVRIECDHSELIAAKGRGGFDTIEKMESVRSLFQEKLFYLLPNGRRGNIDREGRVVVKEGEQEVRIDSSIKSLLPMQEVRYFEAERGVCSYRNFDFIGEEVKMKKYRLRGHSSSFARAFAFPNLTPLSSGEGKKVYFALKEGRVDLRLDAFQTTFDPKEGI